MPTCWDGDSLGDDNDHKSHMAYTVDGTVNGDCPDGFDHRLPQIQLFVRIIEYEGGTYQLSDGSDVFHVDFFNGWEEEKLQEIIDDCEPDDSEDFGYNPPCGCTPEEGDDFLTENEEVAETVCDVDVRELIVDEEIEETNELPRGTCEGAPLIERSWTELSYDLFDCEESEEFSSFTEDPTVGPTQEPTNPMPVDSPEPSLAPTIETSHPTQDPVVEPSLSPLMETPLDSSSPMPSSPISQSLDPSIPSVGPSISGPTDNAAAGSNLSSSPPSGSSKLSFNYRCLLHLLFVVILLVC